MQFQIVICRNAQFIAFVYSNIRWAKRLSSQAFLYLAVFILKRPAFTTVHSLRIADLLAVYFDGDVDSAIYTD
jgi:hypothetical protein